MVQFQEQAAREVLPPPEGALVTESSFGEHGGDGHLAPIECLDVAPQHTIQNGGQASSSNAESAMVQFQRQVGSQALPPSAGSLLVAALGSRSGAGQLVPCERPPTPPPHFAQSGPQTSPTLPASYDKDRHGPVHAVNLARLLTSLQSFRGAADAEAGNSRGNWVFGHAKARASACKGCRGPICPHGPRLQWLVQAAYQN